MAIGKVIQIGRSQAIQLPTEFRVDVDEVFLKRTAEGFVIIVKDPWDVFFEGVEQLSDEFAKAPCMQPKLERRSAIPGKRTRRKRRA
jgi:antitoxin VapB